MDAIRRVSTGSRIGNAPGAAVRQRPPHGAYRDSRICAGGVLLGIRAASLLLPR